MTSTSATIARIGFIERGAMYFCVVTTFPPENGGCRSDRDRMSSGSMCTSRRALTRAPTPRLLRVRSGLFMSTEITSAFPQKATQNKCAVLVSDGTTAGVVCRSADSRPSCAPANRNSPRPSLIGLCALFIHRRRFKLLKPPQAAFCEVNRATHFELDFQHLRRSNCAHSLCPCLNACSSSSRTRR